MRHHSSARQQQINAEYQARREQAYRDMIDKRDMDRATNLVERELGGVEIHAS